MDDEDLDKVYINIGSNRGIAINQQFAVYTKGKPVRDLDTGEVLAYLEKQVAVVAVSEILNDKISVFSVVEMTEPPKIGDVVREITADSDASAESTSETDATKEEK